MVFLFSCFTPNWDNAHYVTANDYYTVSDWENGTNKGVTYENTSCNEGAFVLYHKDKNGEDRYFFTKTLRNARMYESCKRLQGRGGKTAYRSYPREP